MTFIESMRGKPRSRDRTGDVLGPYVVTGPVGANWRTSECWVLKCSAGCGHTLKVKAGDLNSVRFRRSCGGCGYRPERP